MTTTTDGIRLLEEGAMAVNDAVAWSGIGRSRLYQAMKAGDLPYIKAGKRRLIPKRGLKTYLANRLEGVTLDQSIPID